MCSINNSEYNIFQYADNSKFILERSEISLIELFNPQISVSQCAMAQR